MQSNLHKLNIFNEDVYLLQEMDVNKYMSQNHHQIKETMNSIWNASTLQISIPPCAPQIRNPKGGTITIVQGSLTGRIKYNKEDPYGRWSITELFRGQKTPIAIINVYIPYVNHNPGPNTFQIRIATSHPELSHSSEVRTVLWQDISTVVKQYQEQQYGILIGLDDNSNCDDP